MDLVLVGGIAVGLIMGSFGYVLVRFGLRPVITYRRLKRRLSTFVHTAAREETLTDDARETLQRSALAHLQTGSKVKKGANTPRKPSPTCRLWPIAANRRPSPGGRRLSSRVCGCDRMSHRSN